MTAVAACGVVVTIALAVVGRKESASAKDAVSVRSAAVAVATRAPLINILTLSGEFVPFQVVDVHAKVAGYIRSISVDVGDHVRAGQVLAVLEVPELGAQLQGADAAVRRAHDSVKHAQSDLERAKSLHAAAHLDYTRLRQASEARPGLIAQQELDNSLAKDQDLEGQVAASEAALSEAHNGLDVALANQKQYAALSDYTRIVAPFDGVITKRQVDTGALVQAGTNSNTQALPVVSVAQTGLFRLTLPVPESAVPAIHLDTVVKVHVPALNRDLEGRVSRFSDDVDPHTRTMHTEVDVRNPDGLLVGGMIAEVALTLARRDSALLVPVEAVDRDGSTASVMVVNAQNRLEERHIQLGLEGADQIEVVSGLQPGERVVIGSRGEFHPGDPVVPQPIAKAKDSAS
jgi:RND family efflux transporter MFP subunit